MSTRLSTFDDHSMFRQFLDDFYSIRRSLGGGRGGAWRPPTDVYETEEEIVIQVSLPGVNPGDIVVRCNGDVITICGARKGPDPATVRAYHQMEIRNGYFERRLALRGPFDPEKARAKYEDGFLYVNVPKARKHVRHVVTIRLG